MSDMVYKDHRIRGLILEYIAKNPGASFVTIKNVFKMSESTLRYHLDYMQRKKRIALEKEGGRNCYYPYIRKCYPYIKGIVDLSDGQQRLLDIISMSPGINVQELKKRSGMRNGKFTYNLNRLKEIHLIWRKRSDNGIGYEVVTREKIADEMTLLLLDLFLKGDLDKNELEDFYTKLEVYRKKK